MEYEQKLEIMEKTLQQEQVIAEVLSKITKIKSTSSDKKVASILDEIRVELSGLV